jgi:hypothetical protein
MNKSPNELMNLIGPRRPLGIGISVEEYRRSYLKTPSKTELLRWSINPRNATGKWYEEQIARRLDALQKKHGWTWERHVNLGPSKVHLTDKVVDALVNGSLGLELKFLNVEGSLIRPKALVDAIDFSNRRVHCVYVVDGPAWLLGSKAGMSNLEYLDHWWEFTCAEHLERTVLKFTQLSLSASQSSHQSQSKPGRLHSAYRTD